MVGVLRSFDFPLTQYADDVQRIVGTAIRRFGPEEWKLVLLTNEIHGHLGIYSTLGAILSPSYRTPDSGRPSAA